MAAIFSFKCRTCGKLHEGSPSFGFDAPAPYFEQDPQTREAGHLGSDTCWYEGADGRHHFIRTCLEVPIHGVSEPFLWGVWVSLSQRSFERYTGTCDSPDTADCYFGWLCNYLPGYERTYALKTRVHPRAGGERPWIELERSGHPLCVDYHQGISVSRAQEIAEAAAHR